METAVKLKLEKGREYEVELYPQDEIIRAKYIGKRLEKHVFKDINGSAIWYTFLDDDWIIERGGIITYKSVSSFAVTRAERGQLEQISKLIYTLNELGEEIQ